MYATRAGESVAIEIEIGKSDGVRYFRHNLRTGFDRVLVVATDDDAHRIIAQRLKAAGLWPPRVTLENCRPIDIG